MDEKRNCQRCEREAPANWIVTSEILHVEVCDHCAFEAWNLRGDRPDALKIQPLSKTGGAGART